MELFESLVKNDVTYQGHKVFPLLESLVKFYNCVFMLGPDFITKGLLSGLCNVDKVGCGALAGTLDSVKNVLKEGRVNDAFALVRKYHDGIIAILYVNVYIAENYSLDNYVVEKIQQWVNNKQKLPFVESMLKTIRNHKPLNDLEKLFDFDGLYHRIRRLTNGNTHYNKLYYLWLNNNMIYNPNRIKELERLYECILNLFIFHFAYMYSLNPQYMMSGDNIDAFEFGEPLNDGWQKEVAAYVLKVFDEYVTTNRPDVANYMRNNTEMKL